MSYEGHPDQRFGPITYSYCGEDIMVLNLFDMMGIEKPSYLDIGAHHPFTISNTALMYSKGCRGVNVEANPNLISAFKEHRPEDINVNIGVAPNPGVMTFHMWDDHSGRNTFSEEWAKRLEVHTKTIELPVTTLQSIVTDYCNGVFPDFLTIDIEGLDYEVLASTDLAAKIICAEVKAEETFRFNKMMLVHGYFPYSRHGMDVIFINRNCGLYPPLQDY